MTTGAAETTAAAATEMRNSTARLYVFAGTLAVFFVLWATVAAKPWTAASAATKPALDPRLRALNRWERRLRHEARAVDRTLALRWRDYRHRLRVREREIAAVRRRHAQELARARAAGAAASAAASYAPAPSAGVVTLPPRVTVVTLPPASAPATSSGSSHP